jgi:nucleoside permease NupC
MLGRLCPAPSPVWEVGQLVTINVAVLLAVIVFVRLRRRTEARSRSDERLTVVIVLALGVLLAPTPVGQGIMDTLSQIVSGISQAGL